MRRLFFALALCFALIPGAHADPRTDYSPALADCIGAAVLDAAELNACRGVITERCRAEEGDATFALVLCLSDEVEAWERIITSVSERLRSSGEADARPLLDGVHTQWLAYREAECSYRQARFGAGSGSQVELASCFADLTADRAIDLLIYEPNAD